MEHYATAPAPQFSMTDYAEFVDSWLNLDRPVPFCSPGSPTLELMHQELVEQNGPVHKQSSSLMGTDAMWELILEEGSTAGVHAANLGRADLSSINPNSGTTTASGQLALHSQQQALRLEPSVVAGVIDAEEISTWGRVCAGVRDPGRTALLETPRLFLGTCDDHEAAARAYDKAAIGFRGSLAEFNFPPESHAAAAELARDAAFVAAELAGDDAFAAAELARANRNATSFNLTDGFAGPIHLEEDARMDPVTPESCHPSFGVSSFSSSSMVNVVHGYRPMLENSPSYDFDVISSQGLSGPEREECALNFSMSHEAEGLHVDPMTPFCIPIKGRELTGGCQNSGVKGSRWIKLHLDLLGMAPENQGKPAVASMGGKTEVAINELLDIEQLMVKLQVQMKGICFSDLMSLSVEGELKSDQQDRSTLLNRILANKHDNVNIINEITLLKLRNITPPQKTSFEVNAVAIDELLDIEQLMVKIQVQMDKMCSSDVISNLSFEGELQSKQQDNLKIQILATKQDNVKIINELALLKLRNIIPQQKTSIEKVRSNSNLKKSKPLSPLHVPRVSSTTSPFDSEVGVLGPEGLGSPCGTQSATFDIPSPAPVDMLPHKLMRTGHKTKAPFQKPSTIFTPTAKLGGVGVPTLDVPIEPQATTDISPTASARTPVQPTGSLNLNTPHEAEDVRVDPMTPKLWHSPTAEGDMRSASKKRRVECRWRYEQAKKSLLEEEELQRRPQLEEVEEHETRLFREELEKLYLRSETSAAWTVFASDLTNKITKKIQDLELASGRDKVGKLTENAGEILKKVGPTKVGRTVGDAKANSTTLLTVKDFAQILSSIFSQLQSKVNELVPSAQEQIPILKAMSRIIEEGCSVVLKSGLGTEWISKNLHKLVTDLKFRERVVEKHFQNCATSISALVPLFLEQQRRNFVSVASLSSWYVK